MKPTFKVIINVALAVFSACLITTGAVFLIHFFAENPKSLGTAAFIAAIWFLADYIYKYLTRKEEEYEAREALDRFLKRLEKEAETTELSIPAQPKKKRGRKPGSKNQPRSTDQMV